MTDQSLIIAVAKLEGFVQLDKMPNPMFAIEVHEYEAACCHTRASEFTYLTSRDAIIPVIEKVCPTEDKRFEFLGALDVTVPRAQNDSSVFCLVCATPKQLSIALVKATGHYIES